MPLRPSLPWLLTTLAAALVAMTLAAGAIRKAESALAAAVFAIVLVVAAVRTNSPLWRRSSEAAVADVTPRHALRQTAQLIMLAYLWCALAFYAIYIGTHVRWQHGWEYGSALMLIALAHVFYLWRIADPNDSFATPSAIAARRASGIFAGGCDRLRADLADRIGQALIVERRLGCQPTVSRGRLRDHVPEHDHDQKLHRSDGAANALTKRSALTPRTMKARTPCVQRAAYFSAAPGLQAYGIGAVVNSERFLESARCTIGVSIIA